MLDSLKNVEKRVQIHNLGRVFSTKSYRPWTLIYKEKIGGRPEARQREKHFKSGYGKEFLKTLYSDRIIQTGY
ncbi:MAG: hypothetical protein ACD_28C00151G0025 [uncultured bacterium]|nr:MAG: hypothetical protein ACD_28C00151G0025 [uncultured bacterium]KKT77065.1 MAG: Excinuclease ABC C subunit domain protein [Candidatus Peregrinibacteria bacterium GW2011_GWA2_44_7]